MCCFRKINALCFMVIFVDKVILHCNVCKHNMVFNVERKILNTT